MKEVTVREELETIERQSRGNPYSPMYIPRDKVVSEIISAIIKKVEGMPYTEPAACGGSIFAICKSVGSMNGASAERANIVARLKEG